MLHTSFYFFVRDSPAKAEGRLGRLWHVGCLVLCRILLQIRYNNYYHIFALTSLLPPLPFALPLACWIEFARCLCHAYPVAMQKRLEAGQITRCSYAMLHTQSAEKRSRRKEQRKQLGACKAALDLSATQQCILYLYTYIFPLLSPSPSLYLSFVCLLALLLCNSFLFFNFRAMG